MRETIFKPYFTTKPSGNGIGLAVAQQVVRAHGGEISVLESQIGLESEPGRNGQVTTGAAFVIRLPLASSVSAKGPA
jgi:two-component system sensor histidine kinase HydH